MPASYRESPLDQFIANALISRSESVRRLLDPRRSIDHECGYPEQPYGAEDYQSLYEREAVAARVVQVYPRECWACPPAVYEDEDADVVTPFEEAWDGLGRQLRGAFGWHKEEAGSAVWDVLRRADERSGVGHYGGVLIGIDDGLPLDTPAELTPGPTARRKLLYLRVFSEVSAAIKDLDPDPSSPRYGQPLTYSLSLASPQQYGQMGGVSSETQTVHWTRFLHVADNVEEGNDVWGVPRMRPVLTKLLDVHKLYGGSAEMYWQGALPGFNVRLAPGVDPKSADIDIDGMRSAIEEYMGGLQRWMPTVGAEVHSLAPQVVDPRPQIEVQLQGIAVALAIPLRKLMGSERGELASSQDEGDWDGKVKARKQGHCTPRIVAPFVDRLIALGVLPQPGEAGYVVWWPEQSRQTEAEKADIAVKRTQALAAYVAGGVEALIPPLDYLTRELGYTEEEATAILESAEELQEQRQAEEDARMEEEAKALAEAQARQPQPQAGQDGVPVATPAAGGNGVARPAMARA
jgi:hypothetical protein